MERRAFSLVEVIITISIIVLLSIVAVSYNNGRIAKSNNTKVVADISTINTSLLSYKADEGSPLLPMGNLNYFSESGTYVHTGSQAYGMYGQFTENSLSKKYLDLVPLDPRTNQYYSYGVKLSNGQYEIAGVIKDDENFLARVVSTYDGLGGISSLIREYNGPNFVKDSGPNLPYNPEEQKLVARDNSGNVYTTGDTITVPANQQLEIYFSDGSVSILKGENGQAASLTLTELSFPKPNNLISKIKLFLNAGSIWTQASHLSAGSDFEVWTQDTTASVRGTIFKVTKSSESSPNTLVEVYLGEVLVTANNSKENIPVKEGQTSTSDNNNVEITGTSNLNEIPSFTTPSYSNTPINEIQDNTDIISNNNEDYKSEDGVCYVEGEKIANGAKIPTYSSKTCGEGEVLTRTCSGGIMFPESETNIYYSCGAKEVEVCSKLSMTGAIAYQGNNFYSVIYDKVTEKYTPSEAGINQWKYYLTSSNQNSKSCLYTCDSTKGYTWNGEKCYKQEQVLSCDIYYNSTKYTIQDGEQREFREETPLSAGTKYKTITYTCNKGKYEISYINKVECLPGYETDSCTPRQIGSWTSPYNDRTYTFNSTLKYGDNQIQVTSLPIDIPNGKITFTASFRLNQDITVERISGSEAENITCNTGYIINGNSCELGYKYPYYNNEIYLESGSTIEISINPEFITNSENPQYILFGKTSFYKLFIDKNNLYENINNKGEISLNKIITIQVKNSDIFKIGGLYPPFSNETTDKRAIEYIIIKK